MTSIAICRASTPDPHSVSSNGRINIRAKIFFCGPPLGKKHLPQYAADKYDPTKDAPLQKLLSNPDQIASLYINNIAVDPRTRRPLSMNSKQRLFTPSPRAARRAEPITPPDQIIQGYGQIEVGLGISAIGDGASAYPTPAATGSGPKRLNTTMMKYTNKALPPRPTTVRNTALAPNRALANKELPAKPILREKESPEHRGILDATDPVSKRMGGRYPLIQPSSSTKAIGTTSLRNVAVNPSIAKIVNIPRAVNSNNTRAANPNNNRSTGSTTRDYSLAFPGDRRVTFAQYIAMYDENGRQISSTDGNKPKPKPGILRTNRSATRGYAALSPKGKDRANKALLAPTLKREGNMNSKKDGAVDEIAGAIEAKDVVVFASGGDFKVELTIKKTEKDQSVTHINTEDATTAKGEENVDVSAQEKNAEVETGKGDTADDVSEIINTDDEVRRSASYGVGPTIRFSKDAHDVIYGHANSVKLTSSNASKKSLAVPVKTLPVSASIASVASNTSVRKPMTLPGTPQVSSKSGLLGVGIGQKTKPKSSNTLASHAPDPSKYGPKNKITFNSNPNTKPIISVASYDSQRAVTNLVANSTLDQNNKLPTANKPTGLRVPSKSAGPVPKGMIVANETASRLARPTAISAAREQAARAKIQEREKERKGSGAMASIKRGISSMMPRRAAPALVHPKRTSSLVPPPAPLSELGAARAMYQDVMDIVRMHVSPESHLVQLLEEGALEMDRAVARERKM